MATFLRLLCYRKVHNALSQELIQSLQTCFDAVASSPVARVLVLKSKGNNFSAGADLDYMKTLGSNSYEENVKDAMQLSHMFHTLSTLSIPTVAAIQGKSFGGALGLISCCDVAVCEKDSQFCFSEVKLGILPATISPFVVKRIGSSQARRLFLSAEMFSAKTAKEIGLIHETTEHLWDDQKLSGSPEPDKAQRKGILEALERKYVDLFLQNGPQALKKTKELLGLFDSHGGEDEAQSCSRDVELRKKTAELLADVRGSEEAKEGLSSFLEKRKPAYAVKL